MKEIVIHFLITLPLFLVAIVIHEVSHGLVANYFGDPTARTMGRLSLNPLRHVDLIGTVVLPLLLMVTGSPVVFGWAKPVPINYARLAHPKRDLVWVGMAGPLANVLLAVAVAGGLRLANVPPHSLIGSVGLAVILMNLVLAIFNLIPVPPLDGSRVLVGLLPFRYARWLAMMEPFGFVILVGLMYLGVVNRVVWPIVIRAVHWLGVGLP